jgi:hypothetical protein
MKSTFKYLSLATLAIGTTSATALWVTHPNDLKNKFENGEVQTHIGHFGHIPYGSTFTGKLHYPISNRNACAKFEPSDFKTDMIFDEVKDMHPVLLVDHGGCS